MSADKQQEQLEDLTQPAKELTAEEAENVRGGGLPDPWTRSATSTFSNPAPSSLLASETSVQKV